MPSSAVLRLTGPFDLALSLEAAARFLSRVESVPGELRVATYIDRRPTIIGIRQTSRTPPVIRASASISVHRRQLLDIVQWLVSAELDLHPFYRIVAPHPIIGPIVRSLRGLKPLRPASLFEMAIIAITEQQLSLAAAFHIRTRLINRFGTPIENCWLFPTPDKLAGASLRDLRACGLSRQKAEYVRGIAKHVANGGLNFDALKRMTNAEVYTRLIEHRGFGDWSAQYIIMRGLGRLDCLPSEDAGLRRTVGKYLARGRRLSSKQLEHVLAPFAPFRGLAAFYLSVVDRLEPGYRRESRSIVYP